jgi:hypothetical protein
VILLKLHVIIILCVLRERAALQSWSEWIESELCAEKRFVDVEPRTVLIIALKKKRNRMCSGIDLHECHVRGRV